MFVYGDDGADEKRERAISVAVVAGFEDWWRDVEEKWVARCGGIPFHATDCESDHGDYAGRPHANNKAMYRDLTTILAESKVGGVGIAVDLQAQASTFAKESLELTYYRAFLECLTRTADCAENLGEVAALTFDISTGNEYNATLLYETMRDGDPQLLKWLHPEISFMPWKESPRVQMADLLAFEAWKALDHTVGEIKRRRESWEVLRGTQRFETYGYSYDWFRDLKRHIDSGRLGRKVGFTEKDYLDWLSARGQQHNMTNLITFLDWTRKRDETGGP